MGSFSTLRFVSLPKAFLLNIKCVYNPLAQLYTILLLTEDVDPYSISANCSINPNLNIKTIRFFLKTLIIRRIRIIMIIRKLPQKNKGSDKERIGILFKRKSTRQGAYLNVPQRGTYNLPQANITAKHYNSPKANITKKSPSKEGDFLSS